VVKEHFYLCNQKGTYIMDNGVVTQVFCKVSEEQKRLKCNIVRSVGWCGRVILGEKNMAVFFVPRNVWVN